MKKLIFLIASIFAINVYADESSHDVYVQKKITAMMAAYQVPGVAVELYTNGQLSEYYFGYANVETKDPIVKKTIFELGSISKVMTSLLFAQELDWNKMSLTDTVSKYLKTLPKQFDQVTLVELATHTAGLPFTYPHRIEDLEGLNQYLNEIDPEPGQKWAYSNLGMGILGAALAQSTERDFDDLYHRHILNPLQMVNGVNVPAALTKYYAQGYDVRGNTAAQVTPGLLPAATAIKASASDMQKFLSAAIGLPGTPPRVFYPMRMTQSVYAKVGNSYQGLGWQIHKIDNKKDITALLQRSDNLGVGPLGVQITPERAVFNGNNLIDNTGITAGFSAYIAVLPNKKSGIVILMNKQVPDRVIVQTAREILFN
jgi:beta-lactamase class C